MSKQDDLTQRLCKFVHWTLQHGPWIGCDVDGGEIQEKAEELGITIKRIATEEDCNGQEFSEYMEPGDDYFELAPEIKAALGMTQ